MCSDTTNRGVTAAADIVFLDGEVHTLERPDERYEAIAVRDGQIVRCGSTYDIEFLIGTDTTVVHLDGQVVLPGFIDAHTHLEIVGRRLVHADLAGAQSADACLQRLRDRAAEIASDEWVLGFGYDESAWTGSSEKTYLTRAALDTVSETQPVVAVREDLHVAGINSVAFDQLDGELPRSDVRTDASGTPTGVIVEDALAAVLAAVAPDQDEMHRLLQAAQTEANKRGVTGVHDMVRQSEKPQAYHRLARHDQLTIRVRLNYWAEFFDSLQTVGLQTNDGSSLIRVGAIKTYTDGSIGARTAQVSGGYADIDTDTNTDIDTNHTGTWIRDPDALTDLVMKADAAGFQIAAHAIGDVAIDAVINAFSNCSNPHERRHRIEHAELASPTAIEQLAELGVVASMQPNFLRWDDADGLYDTRLGVDRPPTNRFATFQDADVPLAFGSDCMPLDPLTGVQHAVTAPNESQQLDVTTALRAYTHGAAYAGFADDVRGVLKQGAHADLVVLEKSPWMNDSIDDIEVTVTVVDGEIVFDTAGIYN